MARDTADTRHSDRDRGKARAGSAVSRLRVRIAQVVWLVCVLCALVLALGALLVALNANPDNALVQFVQDAATVVDLGVFDRDNGVLELHGDNASTKNALVGWGLAAIVWLIVGRILDWIIRP